MKNLNAARNTATMRPMEEWPGTRRVEAGLSVVVAAGSLVVVGVTVGLPVGLAALVCPIWLVVDADLRGSMVPKHFVWFVLQALWPDKSSGWLLTHCP